MSRPNGTAWNAALSAASRLAPAEDYRRDLAGAIQEAARADFVSILTCPPGDWTALEGLTYPDPYAEVILRIDRDFKPRIMETGEDWAFAIRTHGRVYTPIEAARDRPLADEMRESVLRPADIDGYMVGFLLDPNDALLGIVALGARASRGELCERAFDGLDKIVEAASATLSGAIALSAACSPKRAPTLESHFQPGSSLAMPGSAHPGRPSGQIAASARAVQSALSVLSAREREVTALVAEGYKNLNIGARLDISEPTVATHLRRIFKKLGVASRVELATLWHCTPKL